MKFICFVTCFHKSFKRNRLYKIINYIKIKSLKRKFFISRNKNEHRFLYNALNELQTCNTRHLNVKKNKIHILLLQIFHCFKGIAKRALYLQVRNFAYVIFKQFESKRFIIYSNACKHQCKFNCNDTVNQPSFFVISKV